MAFANVPPQRAPSRQKYSRRLRLWAGQVRESEGRSTALSRVIRCLALEHGMHDHPNENAYHRKGLPEEWSLLQRALTPNSGASERFVNTGFSWSSLER